MFVNLEDKSEVLALDPVALKVSGTLGAAPCEEPTGLAIEQPQAGSRRLFAALRQQQADGGDGRGQRKVVTTVPIGHWAGRRRRRRPPARPSPNGRDGTVTVDPRWQPDKFEVVQTVATSKSART